MNYDFKVSAAGRVNIIGEHVDYCGGKVFPAALSLKNTVYVRANGTDKINLSWTTTDAKVSLDISRLEDYADLKYGNYQAGCALMWKNAGHKLIGCDMLHDCTVPFGSGLSSSAAIEVSTLAALAVIANEKIDKKEIALLAQKAEREWINTPRRTGLKTMPFCLIARKSSMNTFRSCSATMSLFFLTATSRIIL